MPKEYFKGHPPPRPNRLQRAITTVAGVVILFMGLFGFNSLGVHFHNFGVTTLEQATLAPTPRPINSITLPQTSELDSLASQQLSDTTGTQDSSDSRDSSDTEDTDDTEETDDTKDTKDANDMKESDQDTNDSESLKTNSMHATSSAASQSLGTQPKTQAKANTGAETDLSAESPTDSATGPVPSKLSNNSTHVTDTSNNANIANIENNVNEQKLSGMQSNSNTNENFEERNELMDNATSAKTDKMDQIDRIDKILKSKGSQNVSNNRTSRTSQQEEASRAIDSDEMKNATQSEEDLIQGSSYERAQKLKYSFLWNMHPTFFHVKSQLLQAQQNPANGANGANGMQPGEKLFSYWREFGLLSSRDLSTKFGMMQSEDLIAYVLRMDEQYNSKLNYAYTTQNHVYNLNKRNSYTSDGHERIRSFDIYDMYPQGEYKMIRNKKYFFDKFEDEVKNNWQDIELIFPENDTLLFATLEQFSDLIQAGASGTDSNAKQSTGSADKKLNVTTQEQLMRALDYLESLETLKKHKHDDSDDTDDTEDDPEQMDAKDRMRLIEMHRKQRTRQRKRLQELQAIIPMSPSIDAKQSFANGDKYADDGQVNQNDDDSKDSEDSEDMDDIEAPRMINLNGITSDYSYLMRNRSSLKYYYYGQNKVQPVKVDVVQGGRMAIPDFGEITLKNEKNKDTGRMEVVHYNNKFWRLHEHCLRRKSVTVFPHWRILWKSKPLSCAQITDTLLLPIAECLEEFGLKCPMLIDAGYFRYVFRWQVPSSMIYKSDDGEERMIPVVIKIMKPKFFDWIGDWLRHIRESIMLYYMQQWEQDFMRKFGPTFTSHGQARAFRYVPEWGHCLFPTYITVTPFYEMDLEEFILSGMSKNITLKRAVDLSLQVLSGLQVLHNIEGGPFMHTDLQPRQFMMDNEYNVLINDFNRGKFKEYYFESDWPDEFAQQQSDAIIPSYYCMPDSHGHWRAPEEYFSDPLNEKNDIWSVSLVIWSLFSFAKPFGSIDDYEAIKYMIHDQYMRPKLPYNMPPFIKDVMRQCLMQDHNKRPNINQIIKSFQYLALNIETLTQGKQHWTLKQLNDRKVWKETNWPEAVRNANLTSPDLWDEKKGTHTQKKSSNAKKHPFSSADKRRRTRR